MSTESVAGTKLKVKRFVLFWFPQFYPAGGWYDFEGSFDTMEEAQESVNTAKNKCGGDWQVVDLETGEDTGIWKVR